jgi:hypothetical protein
MAYGMAYGGDIALFFRQNLILDPFALFLPYF